MDRQRSKVWSSDHERLEFKHSKLTEKILALSMVVLKDNYLDGQCRTITMGTLQVSQFSGGKLFVLTSILSLWLSDLVEISRPLALRKS